MDQVAGDHNQERAAPNGEVPARLHSGFRVFFDDNIKPYLELFVGIAAIAGLVLVYQQLEAMKETNRITRESNESSDRTTQRALELTEKSNRLTQKAIEESKRQSEANRTQSAADDAASLEIARRSLQESRRALEVSQRARLGIDSLDDYQLREGPGEIMRVILINSGSAPASDVTVRMISQATEGRTPPELIGTPRSHSVIPGDSGQNIPIVMPPFNAEELKAVNEGRWHLYLAGEVKYDDGFGHRRELLFCYVHQSSGMGWEACSTHNRAS